MSLNDKLSALRDLLHSIEEEDGDAYNVALDMVGEYVERRGVAGKAIAHQWHRWQAGYPLTCWLDSGYVTAVKAQKEQGQAPASKGMQVWCPVRNVSRWCALHQHPVGDGMEYAFCESGAAYERWAASLRGEVRPAGPSPWARQEPIEPLRWTLTDAGPGALGLGAELRGARIPEGDLYQSPPDAAFAQVLDGYRRRREATVAAPPQVTMTFDNLTFYQDGEEVSGGEWAEGFLRAAQESAAGTYTFRAASGEWVSQDGRPSIPHPTDPPALPSEEE